MRKLLAWLNRRFPEQLVVTLQDYKELREEVAAYNRIVQGIGQLNDRVVSLEKQVTNLNNAQGFIATGKGSFKLER